MSIWYSWVFELFFPMLKNRNKDLNSMYFKNMIVLIIFQYHSIWTKIEGSFERSKSNKLLILRILVTIISKLVFMRICFFFFPQERVRKLILMRISVRISNFQWWKPSLREYLRIKSEVLYYKFTSKITN